MDDFDALFLLSEWDKNRLNRRHDKELDRQEQAQRVRERELQRQHDETRAELEELRELQRQQTVAAQEQIRRQEAADSQQRRAEWKARGGEGLYHRWVEYTEGCVKDLIETQKRFMACVEEDKISVRAQMGDLMDQLRPWATDLAAGKRKRARQKAVDDAADRFFSTDEGRQSCERFEAWCRCFTIRIQKRLLESIDLFVRFVLLDALTLEDIELQPRVSSYCEPPAGDQIAAIKHARSRAYDEYWSTYPYLDMPTPVEMTNLGENARRFVDGYFERYERHQQGR